MTRLRDTSLAVYHEDIKPSLGRREQIVLDALREWQGPAPTSYELTHYLVLQRLAFDVNNVRPRLTGLLEKHLVMTADKRTCQITGKRALTWMLAPTPTVEPRLNFGDATA